MKINLDFVTQRYFFFGALLFLGLCAIAFGEVPHSGLTNDHLEPPDERFEPKYRTLLSRRLFVTPANYARVVDLPSPASVGETSIAIYSRPDKPNEVFITATKAERNLYYAAFSDNPNVPKNPSMKVARCDAEFPASTANAVTAIVRRVLSGTRARKKGGAIILHGTEIEFSIENAPGGTVRGLLTPYAKGKNGKALRSLAQLLQAYCAATQTERESLARRIEAQARNLPQ